MDNKPEACSDPACLFAHWGKHIHGEEGRWIPECSWHRGEFHMICSEGCN